jgi:hypothetical protein
MSEEKYSFTELFIYTPITMYVLIIVFLIIYGYHFSSFVKFTQILSLITGSYIIGIFIGYTHGKN